jgi:plasmid stabilization system protein ParE
MRIFWTKRSKNRFQDITEHLKSAFGIKTSEGFKIRVLDFLELLSKFPELGSLEVPDKEIYGFQLSKQTRLFYRLKENQIILLTFFDSRQDPKKKPK